MCMYMLHIWLVLVLRNLDFVWNTCMVFILNHNTRRNNSLTKGQILKLPKYN